MQQAGNKQYILVIEDEPAFRDMITAELTKAGYTNQSAVDGEEGLEKMRLQKPDLVLLDIVMPRKDGFSVIEEMKGDPDLSKIPIVVLSNSGDTVELSRVKDMGVSELLIKTAFGPKEFIEKLREILDREGQVRGGGAGEVGTPQNLGTILIIEDDPFLWSLIRSKLIKEGFNVTVAQDGEKGLKEAKEAKPDLVLLDLILPDLDGFSVLEQLKKDEVTASIPVIILSNLGQQEDVARGTALGAKDYLIKAHHAPQEIVERVKKVLGK